MNRKKLNDREKIESLLFSEKEGEGWSGKTKGHFCFVNHKTLITPFLIPDFH